MVTPLEGILALALIFALCFTGVVSVKILLAYSEYKKQLKNSPEPQEEVQRREEPKIYYITDRLKERKKRKKRKKPNIALDGIVVRPKEFQKLSDK